MSAFVSNVFNDEGFDGKDRAQPTVLPTMEKLTVWMMKSLGPLRE